jgi:hypothetical protein
MDFAIFNELFIEAYHHPLHSDFEACKHINLFTRTWAFGYISWYLSSCSLQPDFLIAGHVKYRFLSA